jgi:hypothetical protein
MPGFESGNAVLSGLASRQHVDGSGDLGGAQCLGMGNANFFVARFRRTDIPWEDVVYEAWMWPSSSIIGYFRLAKDADYDVLGVRRQANGTLRHFINGSGQESTTDLVLVTDRPKMLSTHFVFDATTGSIESWIDGRKVLSSTNKNTTTGASNCNGIELRAGSVGTLYVDDVGVRPRTILVDGVGGAKTDTPTDITGTTESATVYAWENDTTDSAGGSGDPTLGANEWRLYLRDVSFGPDDFSTPGFVHSEVVTVTGLTAAVTNITVNVPHAGFKEGLEPGSMFYYQKLHILRQAVSGVGTEDTDGTLQGGAANRADALDTDADGLAVRHTAAAESVTLSITGLSAAQEAVINEVVGLVVAPRGLYDSGTPDSLIPRVLDNAGSAQNGVAGTVGTGNTTVWNFFHSNGRGGIWTTGTGAGGVVSSEPGYETV